MHWYHVFGSTPSHSTPFVPPISITTPHLNFMYSFKPTESTSVIHMHMSVWLSTGTWANMRGCILVESRPSLSVLQLPVSPQSPIRGLWLTRPCAGPVHEQPVSSHAVLEGMGKSEHCQMVSPQLFGPGGYGEVRVVLDVGPFRKPTGKNCKVVIQIRKPRLAEHVGRQFQII